MKVICVDDRFHPAIADWGDQLPRIGLAYTIREIRLCPEYATREIGIGLKFQELQNPGDQLNFSDWHFKPLEEQQANVNEAENLELITA